jgi:hypothetical protein
MRAPMQRRTKGKRYLDAVLELGEAVAKGGGGYAREENESKKGPRRAQAWLHFRKNGGQVIVAMLVRSVWGTLLMTTRRYDADVSECIGTCMAAMFTSGQDPHTIVAFIIGFNIHCSRATCHNIQISLPIVTTLR